MNEPNYFEYLMDFKCDHCSQEFSLDTFRAAVFLYGVIFLLGKEFGYIGIVCPNCTKTSLKKCEIQTIYDVKNEIHKSIFVINQKKIQKWSVENFRNKEICNLKFIKIHYSDNIYFEFVSPEETEQNIDSWLPLDDNEPFSHSMHPFASLKYNSFSTSHIIKSPIMDDFEMHVFDVSKSSMPLSNFTEDQFNIGKEKDVSFRENNLCTYLPKTASQENATTCFWLKDEDISELLRIENDKKIRVFPRYIFSNKTLEAYEKFSADLYKSSQSQTSEDNLVFTKKMEIYRNLSFLNLLESDDKLNLLDFVGGQILLQNNFPVKNDGLSKAFKGLELALLKQLYRRPKFVKMIGSMWAEFTNQPIQEILFQKSFEFAVEYYELAKRTDCLYTSKWRLKEKYLKDIYNSLTSPSKRKKLRHEISKPVSKAVKEAESKFPSVNIISQDHRINEIKIKIADYAQFTDSNIDILITGENGTGKELFVKAIHEAWRKEKAFVSVDCATIPKDLFESRFYGHKKGSFTGATSEMEGFFKQADGGILFLDEIGNLNPEHQMKFLRVLETREIQPIGSTKSVKVDVRIVFATNANLINMVHDGTFREDLFYRINAFHFPIPPLRDRKNDIRLLVDHFIRKNDIDKKKNPDLDTIQVSDDFIVLLKQSDWPGNVRELENLIKKFVVDRLSKNNRGEITPLDVPSQFRELSSRKKTKIPSPKEKIELTPANIRRALQNNKTVKAAAREMGYSRGHFSRTCSEMRRKGEL